MYIVRLHQDYFVSALESIENAYKIHGKDTSGTAEPRTLNEA